MNSLHDFGTSGAVQASSYPEIIYEIKPNLNMLFKKARLRTNSEGLCDDEYSKQKSADSFRIAVVGDSYTMPSGVPIESAYHTLLENQLTAKFPNRKIEVINFGVGGYQLRQYAAVIESKVVDYNPDLVLIGFCLANDFKMLPEEVFKRKYLPNRTTWPFFTLQSMRLTRDTLIRIQNAIAKKTPPQTSPTPEEEAYMSKYFHLIKQLSDTYHFKILLTALNNKPSVPALSAFLEEISRQNGFVYVDVTRRFKDTVHREFSITREDGHPNEKAHRIFAEQIYPAVATQAEIHFNSVGSTKAPL